MDQHGSAWIKHASAWMKHERIPESSYGRGTKFARPRPLNLGLETSDIGASSRSRAPRARGLGHAPRLRAAGAGEQCSQSLHRRAVDARAAEESTSTTTTMAESMHGCVAGFDSRPALTAWPGLTPGPGRPSLSCVRAGVRCARARARVDVSLSLSPAGLVSALSQRQSSAS